MLGCKEFYDKTAASWAEKGYPDAAELSAAMGGDFTLVREMPSNMKIWAYYLFQKIEEVRV